MFPRSHKMFNRPCNCYTKEFDLFQPFDFKCRAWPFKRCCENGCLSRAAGALLDSNGRRTRQNGEFLVGEFQRYKERVRKSNVGKQPFTSRDNKLVTVEVA